VAADRGHRGHDAVEHEMGVEGHQHRILRAHRLALGAVRDDDRRTARRHCAELDRSRKARAAAPGQPALLDLLDQRPVDAGKRRQARRLSRPLSRLVTIRAATRSSETAPRPTQNALRPATKGTITATTRTAAYGSTTAVTTCTARKTTARSEMLRCRPSAAKPGSRRVRQRLVVAMPSTNTAVSNRSETTPLARIRYQ